MVNGLRWHFSLVQFGYHGEDPYDLIKTKKWTKEVVRTIYE